MPFECLIAPTETIPNLNAVKRAILTYDKVILVDPNDRDLFPGTLFTTAMGMPPIFSIDSGPVRPMGKLPNYDNDFDELSAHLQPAISDGIVQIKSIYRKPENRLMIGKVDRGGYPLNESVVLDLYRRGAANQNILTESVRDLQKEIPDFELWKEISLSGRADGKINQSESMPLISKGVFDNSLVGVISNIARARIASFIKILGYCEAKELVPLYGNSFYVRLLNQYLKNARDFIDQIPEDDYWSLQSRAVDVIYNEYLEDKKLDLMSLQDVMKMRTSLWGKQAEARDDLFKSVRQLAQENKKEEDFESAIKKRVENFRLLASELEDQRKELNAKIRINIMTSSGIMGASEMLALPMNSICAFLIIATYGLQKYKSEYSKQIRELKTLDQKVRGSSCYGANKFFRNNSI